MPPHKPHLAAGELQAGAACRFWRTAAALPSMFIAAVGRIGLTAGAAALAWYGRRQLLRRVLKSMLPQPLSVAVNLPADRTLTSGELVVLCSSDGAPVVLQRTDGGWNLRAITLTPGEALIALSYAAVSPPCALQSAEPANTCVTLHSVCSISCCSRGGAAGGSAVRGGALQQRCFLEEHRVRSSPIMCHVDTRSLDEKQES